MASPLSQSGTLIHLQSGFGSRFPNPQNVGEFFLVTLEDTANPFSNEIVSIVARNNDVLTIGSRGLEGTTAKAWVENTTLVDHRITAETIRQAFLQPVSSGGSGGGSISGENLSPISIDPNWTVDISSPIIFANLKRGHKFWVTLLNEQNGKAQTFEVLTVVQGLLGSNNETVEWTKTNRIGYNFLGTLSVELDKANTTLSLMWTNLEPSITITATVAHLSL